MSFQTPNRLWRGWNLLKTNVLSSRKNLTFIRSFSKDRNISKVNNKLKVTAIILQQPPNRNLRKAKSINKNIKIILGEVRLWNSLLPLPLKYRDSGESTYSENGLSSSSSLSTLRKSNPSRINLSNWNLTTKKSSAWFSFKKKKKSFLEPVCMISQNIRICNPENNCWNRRNRRNLRV